MMNHRKKFSRKYLYKESAFDQLGRSALESDEDNVMVPVVSDEALGGVVTAFPAVINPPEFYNQSNMIIGDIDRISGVSEFQRGAVSEIRRTATESSLLQDAANARTSDKLAVVEQAIAADQIAIAHNRKNFPRVNKHRSIDAERASEDVSLRMHRGFGGSEAALALHRGHKTVVFGDLSEFAVR